MSSYSQNPQDNRSKHLDEVAKKINGSIHPLQNPATELCVCLHFIAEFTANEGGEIVSTKRQQTHWKQENCHRKNIARSHRKKHQNNKILKSHRGIGLNFLERLGSRAGKQFREQSYYQKTGYSNNQELKSMAQMNTRTHRTKSLICHCLKESPHPCKMPPKFYSFGYH